MVTDVDGKNQLRNTAFCTNFIVDPSMSMCMSWQGTNTKAMLVVIRRSLNKPGNKTYTIPMFQYHLKYYNFTPWKITSMAEHINGKLHQRKTTSKDDNLLFK